MYFWERYVVSRVLYSCRKRGLFVFVKIASSSLYQDPSRVVSRARCTYVYQNVWVGIPTTAAQLLSAKSVKKWKIIIFNARSRFGGRYSNKRRSYGLLCTFVYSIRYRVFYEIKCSSSWRSEDRESETRVRRSSSFSLAFISSTNIYILFPT